MADAKWINDKKRDKYFKIPDNFFDLKPIEQLNDAEVILYLQLYSKSYRNRRRERHFFICEGFKITPQVVHNVFYVKNTVKNTEIILNKLEYVGLIMFHEDSIEIFNPWKEDTRDRSAPEYKDWRFKVFKRDKFTCQKCGKQGLELNAHHIESWASTPSKRFDVSNGMTLCIKCHKEVHKRRRNGKV